MPIDRDEALRRAEKLLRQGRLDAAIDEYEQLAAALPTDLSVSNTLGDLLARAGSVERAAAEFERIADHLFREGFLPKAAALYKKVLKIVPDHIGAHRQLAEIAVAQGMAREARTTLLSLVEILRARRDEEAVGVTLRRLADLDPNDVPLQREAATLQAQAGDAEGASQRLKELASRLSEAGRLDESLQVWQAVHALEPSNAETRVLLARAALAQQRLDDAGEFLGALEEGASSDHATLHAEVALRRGAPDDARAALEAMLAGGLSRAEVVDFALAHGRDVDHAFIGAAIVASQLARDGQHAEAVGILQQFVARHPRHAPALAELLERAIDGGLTAVAVASQRGLVEAHIDAGQLAEARLVAEDLVSRSPHEPEHQASLLRVFELLGDSDAKARLQAHLASLDDETALNDLALPEGTGVGAVRTSPGRPLHLAGTDSSTAPHDTSPGGDSRRGSGSPLDGRGGEPSDEDREPGGEGEHSEQREQREKGEQAGSGEQTDEGQGGERRFGVDQWEDSARPATAGRVMQEIDLTPALEALAQAAASGAPESWVPSAAASRDRLDSAEGSAAGRSYPVRERDEVSLKEASTPNAVVPDDEDRRRLSAGLALIEAGLYEEAAPLLEEAARGVVTQGAATVALGDLARLRGEAAQAEKYYHRVLVEPHSTAVQRRARYGLGCMLADAGRTPEALVVWLELLADAGEYLDTRARVDALSEDSAGG